MSFGTTSWDDLWDDLWQRSMPSPDAAARHTGAGVARRQAHHERMRDERAREAAAGDAELPPEDDAVEMASAAQLLDSVAEVGPNYTLLRSKETKAKRRKRQREDARAALDGHTVLPTGSRLEIFCDSERWYPATVMAREEDRDGRIVHEVEYDGYPDRRWWHNIVYCWQIKTQSSHRITAGGKRRVNSRGRCGGPPCPERHMDAKIWGLSTESMHSKCSKRVTLVCASFPLDVLDFFRLCPSTLTYS